MNIVGFNFTKISAERNKAVVGSVRISNNIHLRDVKDAKIGMGERGAVSISFVFQTQYQPDFATIVFEGDVLGLVDQKNAVSLVEAWKKDKRLSPDVSQGILNYILDRCSIQALLISKDLGLPSPVPLPKVNFNQNVAAPASSDDVKTTKIEKPKKK